MAGRPRGMLTGLAMVVFLLGAASPAGAGVVQYDGFEGPEGGLIEFVSYAAPLREVNNVTAGIEPPGRAVIRDPGKLMYPPEYAIPETLEHCSLALGEATCTADGSGFSSLDLYLGRRDDNARLTAATNGSIWAGPGNDVLRGSSGPNYLMGEEGSDELFGADGTDRAEYPEEESSGTGVRVSLDDVANDGPPGDRDNVHSDIEDLTGTATADILIAGDANNSLEGRGGDDELEARGGDDKLYGDSGKDRLDSGAGDDFVLSDDGEVDSVLCGDGFDRVRADAVDQLSDCEEVGIG